MRSKRGAPDEKLLAFARCQCRFQCRCLGVGFPVPVSSWEECCLPSYACLCLQVQTQETAAELKFAVVSRGLWGPKKCWEHHWGQHQRLSMWVPLLQVIFSYVLKMITLSSICWQQPRCVHGHVHCQLGHEGRPSGPGILDFNPLLSHLQISVCYGPDDFRSFGKGFFSAP